MPRQRPKLACAILACLPLMPGLSACATRTPPRFVEPPETLMRRCPLPDLAHDPALDLLALSNRVLECDERAAGVIAWRDGLRGRQPPDAQARSIWRFWE